MFAFAKHLMTKENSRYAISGSLPGNLNNQPLHKPLPSLCHAHGSFLSALLYQCLQRMDTTSDSYDAVFIVPTLT